MIRNLVGVDLPYSYIAVEKEGVNKCGQFLLDDELLNHYEMINERNLIEMAECRKSGVWHTRFEQPVQIYL